MSWLKYWVIESFIMHNLIGCLIDIILVYLWFCPWFCHVLMNLRLLANTVYRVYTHINRDWTLPRYFVKCHLFWANSQISRQNNIQFMFPGVTDLNVVKNVLFPWKSASDLWFLVLENREKGPWKVLDNFWAKTGRTLFISWIPWNLSFRYIHCTGQFTPRMKPNAVPCLLSSLVWIDHYNECNRMTNFMEFMKKLFWTENLIFQNFCPPPWKVLLPWKFS